MPDVNWMDLIVLGMLQWRSQGGEWVKSPLLWKNGLYRKII